MRAERAHRRGGLLWHREFRLLWIGETVSGAGSALAAAGVPLLAATVLHASAFAVAAVTAAAYLPWLVIGLPCSPRPSRRGGTCPRPGGPRQGQREESATVLVTAALTGAPSGVCSGK